ncbi:MAG: trigger factor, partial [Elusimicrobiota bacterium]
HSYEVELPAPAVQEALHNAFIRLQSRARIPGFRQGKAPIDLIKKQYADHARSEAADALLRGAVPEALRELGLEPVSSPSVADFKMTDGSPLVFELRVEVAPRVEPQGYKSLALRRTTYSPEESQVLARLTEVQEGNARLEKSEAEAVSKSHYVVVDYEILREGKRLPGAHGKQELVDMSSEQSIEGLTEGLLGAKRGESREFPVKTEGQAGVCKVSVSEIKEKILPPLDDEFAKDMGLDSLDALKAKLREMIEAEAKERSERELLSQIESALLSSNRFPIPESLAQAQLDHSLDRLVRRFGARGIPEAELAKLRDKIKPQAEAEVRLSFILSAIGRKENLSVSEDDLKKELERNLQKAETDDQKKDVREYFEAHQEGIA